MISSGAQNLLNRTRSFLSVYDEAGLLRYLRSAWTPDELIGLLAHEQPPVVKVAATCLGLIADPVATPSLVASLGHLDAVVSEMAEHALWTIWFKERGPGPEALLRAAEHTEYRQSTAVLEALIDKYPDWAEPYHRRAILNHNEHFFMAAAHDCMDALEAQEHHFGAWAQLGHTFSELGNYAQSLDCYRRALEIHPRLGGVRRELQKVRELIGSTPTS